MGAALPVGLTDNLSFVATGWYLVPGYSTLNSNEFYATITDKLSTREQWGAKPSWWFVDGALRTHSADPVVVESLAVVSLLLGVRYDYYTVGITSPDNIDYLFDNGDAGDVISRGVIPFVGFQVSYKDTVQNLSVRLIGIPTIVGSSYVGLTTTGGNRFR